ncbi:MAG: response regulator [Deltaproteobacteria bacterium]|nr:response regulator [Deltaproteobacteria bacterium]
MVEDQDSLCEMVAIYLRVSGYRVRTANDGVTAVEILDAEKVNLVLLDLMLPLMNGFEVLQVLQQKKRDLIPYIIVVSAMPTDKNKKKALEMGANEFISKPFNFSVLLERIQALEKMIGTCF